MPKIIFILVVFLFSQSLSAQITIAPEAGIYSRPYIFNALSNGVYQNKREYFAGIMGEVRILPTLYTQARLAYVWKHDINSKLVLTTPPDLDYAILYNQELTFNVDLLYEPIKRVKVGAGIGMINKLDSFLFEKYIFRESENSYFSNNNLYTASFVIDYSWKRTGVAARLFYLITEEQLDSPVARVWENDRGFTVGLNYKLIGYKDKKIR
jgi:hypothetical protein